MVPVARPLTGPCATVAAFALLEPGAPAALLALPQTYAKSLAYPEDASIVKAGLVDVRSSGCAGGTVVVRSLSLFDGAVSAKRVVLRVSGDEREVRLRGLAVGGKRIAVRTGIRLRLGAWAYAIVQPRATANAAVLEVHLLKRHSGLAAGTVVAVSFANLASPAALLAQAATARAALAHAPKRPRERLLPLQKRDRKRTHTHKGQRGRPLKVTPPLGAGEYVFPVVGASDYIDTYGGFRGDVPGNWHHGDDIFAELGTPVVAVATGTLNRVGWARLGGWRLWVRDRHRNQFYYAHLSGYSPLALSSKHVKAGDVLGYIGNTGDAFTTSPHLHFEIHPVSLLRLDYNGAVNPTTYLDSWRHLASAHAPVPAHPPFPRGRFRTEARYVWRQLLAARGLIPHAPPASERPRIVTPGPDRAAAPPRADMAAAARDGSDQRASLFGLVAAALAVPALSGFAFSLRRRRRQS